VKRHTFRSWLASTLRQDPALAHVSGGEFEPNLLFLVADEGTGDTAQPPPQHCIEATLTFATIVSAVSTRSGLTPGIVMLS
jgi:hypothetical protein